ncbi:hypothetical protein N2152v2_008995 [Parachlorella kessleri]
MQAYTARHVLLSCGQGTFKVVLGARHNLRALQGALEQRIYQPAGSSPSHSLLPKLASRISQRNINLSSRAVAAPPSAPLASSSSQPNKYDTELAAAVEAVRLASQLCQAVQVELKAGEKSEKGDASPVTVADYGAQALVAWSLQQSFPEAKLSLVAEEDAEDLRAPEGQAMLERITHLVNEALCTLPSPPEHLQPQQVADLIDCGGSQGGPVGRHWVLDPIDGTRGFVGMRQYAVCLGMLQEGQVVVGVLGCPNMPQAAISDEDCDDVASRSFDESIGMLFAAQRGCGTYAGSLWSEALPMQRVFVDDLPPAQCQYMESFETKHSDHALAAGIAQEIGVELPSLRLDSQAKYGALARGDASIFMRFPPVTYREKIWDHCAGSIVVEEAGGKISDATGQPLDFSQGRYLPLNPGQPGIIAATPSMHAAILNAFRKLANP